MTLEAGNGGSSGCPTATQLEAEGAVVGADKEIANLRPKLHDCYVAALASNASLAGRMTVRVEVAPEGDVYSARIAEGRMASAEVQSCVLDAIRTLHFSPPRGGSAELMIPITYNNPDAGADSGAPSVPGRHPCRAAGGCSAGTVAWCDVNEGALACCAPGLVAVGQDGICACPSGGSVDDAGPCPRGPLSRKEWKAAYDRITSAWNPVPCARAADAGRIVGGVKLEIGIGPDGDVVNARITAGKLASAVVQRCMLDTIRATKYPPPIGGWQEESVAIDFDREPVDAKKHP